MAEYLGYVLHVNGTHHEVHDAWLGESLLYVLRERLGLYRQQGSMRAGRVRIVQRTGRRRVGLRMPRTGGVGRRTGHRHDRRHRSCRVTQRCAARVRGLRSGAMRVLHAWAHHGVARAARAHTATDRHRDPGGTVRQHLPMHRLRTDHRSSAARRHLSLGPTMSTATREGVLARASGRQPAASRRDSEGSRLVRLLW